MQAALDAARSPDLPFLWKRSDRQYMMRSEKRPTYRPQPGNNGRKRRPRRRFWYALITLLLLLLLWPVGLIMLWARKLRWRGSVKAAVTVATGLVSLAAFSFLLTAPTQNDAILSVQANVRNSMNAIAESVDRAARDSDQFADNAARITAGTLRLGRETLVAVLPAAQSNMDAVFSRGGMLAAALADTGLNSLKQALYETGLAPTPSPSPTPEPAPSPTPSPTSTPQPSPPVEMVWRVPGEALYHNDPTCGGIAGAEEVTLSEAIRDGLMPCEICVLGADSRPAALTTQTARPTSTPNLASSPALPEQTAQAVSKAAVLPTQQAASGPTPSASPPTPGASSPMPGASPSTPGALSAPSPSPVLSPSPLPTAVVTPLPTVPVTQIALPAVKPVGEMLVWHTPRGKFYHLDKTCQGMMNATQYTLASSVAEGFRQCTRCGPPAPELLEEEFVVWCGEDHLFHITDECEALTDKWTAMSFAEALLEEGYAGCAVCGADLHEQSAKTPVSTPAPAEPAR